MYISGQGNNNIVKTDTEVKAGRAAEGKVNRQA